MHDLLHAPNPSFQDNVQALNHLWIMVWEVFTANCHKKRKKNNNNVHAPAKHNNWVLQAPLRAPIVLARYRNSVKHNLLTKIEYSFV